MQILILTINKEIKEVDSIESAIRFNPIVIILKEETEKGHTTRSGWHKITFNYKFIDQHRKETKLTFGRWSTKSSNKAVYSVEKYENGWSPNNLKFKSDYSNTEYSGIVNKFTISDPNGEVKDLWFQNINDLVLNLGLYSQYSSWKEFQQYVIIDKLKKENKLLKKKIAVLKKNENS